MDWNTIISYIFDNLPAILSLIFVWVKLNKFGENINKTGLDAAYLKGNFDNHIKEHKKIPISLAKSKTALTDRGNKILKESGVEQYLKDNFDALYEQLKDSENNYVLQERCSEILSRKAQELTSMYGEYLYNNGESVYSLVGVMSIVLRDMAIEKKTEAESRK